MVGWRMRHQPAVHTMGMNEAICAGRTEANADHMPAARPHWKLRIAVVQKEPRLHKGAIRRWTAWRAVREHPGRR